jgi:hypothetical protein
MPTRRVPPATIGSASIQPSAYISTSLTSSIEKQKIAVRFYTSVGSTAGSDGSFFPPGQFFALSLKVFPSSSY